MPYMSPQDHAYRYRRMLDSLHTRTGAEHRIKQNSRLMRFFDFFTRIGCWFARVQPSFMRRGTTVHHIYTPAESTDPAFLWPYGGHETVHSIQQKECRLGLIGWLLLYAFPQTLALLAFGSLLALCAIGGSAWWLLSLLNLLWLVTLIPRLLSAPWRLRFEAEACAVSIILAERQGDDTARYRTALEADLRGPSYYYVGNEDRVRYEMSDALLAARSDPSSASYRVIQDIWPPL